MDELEKFKEYLLELGQEKSTVKTNLKLIKKVLQDVVPLVPNLFNKSIKKRVANHNAKNYIRQIVNVTRLYGDFIGDKKLARVPYPKLRNKSTFIRAIMSNPQIDEFVSMPFLSSKKQPYYKERWDMMSMFWIIMAYSAMRPIEVSLLRASTDIDLGRKVFIIRKTKTHEPREIPINETIVDKIEAYVKDLKTDLLFPSMYDPEIPITGSAWRENFKKRKKRMKLKFEVKPYSLRHSWPSRNIRKSSIYDIKEIMGHAKITSTEVYLHTDLEQKRETINNDPLGKENQSGEEILYDVVKAVQASDIRYRDKIYTQYYLSEDGRELTVIRKVRG